MKSKLKVKQRIKLFIILGVEFIVIAAMLLLIFFAGKQSYTVTFDLNGGTLLSGDPVQRVTQGHSATPPTAVKEGHYFLKWRGSYSEVTHDVVVVAVWEYETSPGIQYEVPESSNYCTISSCFKDVQGEIYIGAYYGNKKVLGIEKDAFKDCTGITAIHLLDGILTIGDGAFSGCTNLTTIDMPSTVVTMGNDVFSGCEKLEEMLLPTDLKSMGDNVFKGCSALSSVTLPEGLKSMGDGVFMDCSELSSVTLPEGLESVGASAFKNCRKIEEIILPRSLVTIGSGAFSYDLFSIQLPELELGGVGERENNNSEEAEGLLAPISRIFLTIYTYYQEEERPEGWASDFMDDHVKIVWGYEDPVEDGEENSAEEE